MEYRRSEISAGIFLVVSFMVLVAMVFAVSDVKSLFIRKKEIKVLFSSSDGIEKNAPVRYAGLKIGKVREVRISPEYPERVELILSVRQDADIRSDAKAAIKSVGLIGGKYLEFTAGTRDAPLLAEGETLRGEESLKLEDLSRIALDVVAKFKNIAANLDRMFGDPALAKSLNATISDLRQTAANIREMTANKDRVSESLAAIPEMLKKLDDSLASLKSMTEKSDKLVGENRKNIDAMLEHFRDLGSNLKDTSEDVKKAPWKLLRKP